MNYKTLNEQYKKYKETRKYFEKMPKTPNLHPTKKRGLILVPYRPDAKGERIKHYNAFLNHMPTMLDATHTNCDITIIEQSGDSRAFNRGALLNVGVQMFANYDYYVLHDIDMLPTTDAMPFYGTFPQWPLHIAATTKKYTFWAFLGAVLSVSRQHLQESNGFPNTFWGWGGEDDALYNRLVRGANIHTVWIPTPELQPRLYNELDHTHQGTNNPKVNNDKKQNILRDLRHWKKDGLQQTKYKVLRKMRPASPAPTATQIQHVLVRLDSPHNK